MSDHNADSDTTADMRTVSFPTHLFAEATAIIDKANRRLERVGVADRFTLTLGQTHTVTFIDEHGNEVTEERTTATLNTPLIGAQGWQFIASLEHDPAVAAVLLRPHPEIADADTLPIPTQIRCDHCKTTRPRRYGYYIRNTETGELMQLGKQCVAPFLGMSVNALWSLGADLGFDALGRQVSTRAERSYSRDQVLALAWVLSDEGRNYRNSQAGENSTRSQVLDVMFPPPRATQSEIADLAEVRAQALAVPADTVAQVIAAVQAMDGEGSYAHNMRAIVASEMVSFDVLGYLVSAVTVYRRAVDGQGVYEQRQREREERQRERKALLANTPQGLIAEPGTKITGVHATVMVTASFYNDFGERFLNVLRADDSGHLLKWLSSSDAAAELNIGDRVLIERATIKELDHYDGQDQSVILRPKITVIQTQQDQSSE